MNKKDYFQWITIDKRTTQGERFQLVKKYVINTIKFQSHLFNQVRNYPKKKLIAIICYIIIISICYIIAYKLQEIDFIYSYAQYGIFWFLVILFLPLLYLIFSIVKKSDNQVNYAEEIRKGHKVRLKNQYSKKFLFGIWIAILITQGVICIVLFNVLFHTSNLFTGFTIKGNESLILLAVIWWIFALSQPILPVIILIVIIVVLEVMRRHFFKIREYLAVYENCLVTVSKKETESFNDIDGEISLIPFKLQPRVTQIPKNRNLLIKIEKRKTNSESPSIEIKNSDRFYRYYQFHSESAFNDFIDNLSNHPFEFLESQGKTSFLDRILCRLSSLVDSEPIFLSPIPDSLHTQISEKMNFSSTDSQFIKY